MEIIVVTVGLIATIMAAMAIGVMAGRKPLRGSCGGVGGTDCLCEKEGVPKQCQELKEAVARVQAEDPDFRI